MQFLCPSNAISVYSHMVENQTVGPTLLFNLAPIDSSYHSIYNHVS
jgi:hypothetical protein